MTTTPDDKIFNNGEYDNYAEVMHSRNALRRNNDEIETKPKANKSWKWKHILNPISNERNSLQETLYQLRIPQSFYDVTYCTCRKTRYTNGK